MRRYRLRAEQGYRGKLTRRAEWQFPLGRGGTEGVAAERDKIVRAHRRKRTGEQGGTPGRVAPKLLRVNELPWEVFLAAINGKQFLYRVSGVVLPMGGAVIKSDVAGFNYEAVLGLIDNMVPLERRREVFAKFQLLEPFALRAVGGGDAESPAAGAGDKGERHGRRSGSRCKGR